MSRVGNACQSKSRRKLAYWRQSTIRGGRDIRVLTDRRTRRCIIAVDLERPYVQLSSEQRRNYADLSEAEKAIIQVAIQRDFVTRDVVLGELTDQFTKTDLRDAFSALCDEQRLFRVGNKAEHVLIERDLF